MNVAIIGTGNMARGLATRALAAGYDVTVRGTGFASSVKILA